MTAATLARNESTTDVATRRRRRSGAGGRWFVLVPALAFVLLPIYWMVASALKSNPELSLLEPTLYPHAPTLDQFRQALADGSLLAAVVNSAAVAVPTTLVVLLIGSAGAYAMTQWRFPGVNGVLGLTLLPSCCPRRRRWCRSTCSGTSSA